MAIASTHPPAMRVKESAKTVLSSVDILFIGEIFYCVFMDEMKFKIDDKSN